MSCPIFTCKNEKAASTKAVKKRRASLKPYSYRTTVNENLFEKFFAEPFYKKARRVAGRCPAVIGLRVGAPR